MSTVGLALLLSLQPVPFAGAAPALAEAPAISAPVDAPVSTASGRSIATTTTTAAADSGSSKTPSRRYINLTGFPFPLGPFTERRTVETELVKGTVYGFEQEQSLSGITANVRSVVFRMRDNHLLVYNPVAPTEEFLKQLEGLNHDGVSHILLGATQYEHKIFVAPFARKFPEAKVWAVPDQWSFPLDLPAPLLGIDTTGSGGGELLDTTTSTTAYANAPDLLAEFEVKLLRPEKRLGFGYAANEAALLHKDSKTLALTDALVNVPAAPPEIYDRANLLGIGDNRRDGKTIGNLVLKAAATVNWRGTAAQEVQGLWSASDARGQGDAPEVLQRGWERNTLLSLYFGPSPASLVDPDASFQKLTKHWVVAPVTDSLIYRSERVKPELARWVNDVGRWDFTMIAPAHFDALAGTPDDLRAAFAPTLSAKDGKPYLANDVRLLDDLAGALQKLKVI